MLRSRIARTNSKLEIFIGIVDCHPKKSLSFPKSLFYQLHFQVKLSSFFYLSPYSPMPQPLQNPRVLSSHDALRRTTYIFHGIWVFSRVWSIKLTYSRSEYIFPICKTFTRYLLLQNAHKPNTKTQWFLITIVRQFFFLIWPWTRSCGWIFCLQHNVSVDFVNPQGMAILGNYTCGYMEYIHRGLWPLYFWPKHLRQALTKVFHNSNSVNIICLPHCHSIFMLKKFISPAKGEILEPAGKKGGCLVM